MADVALIALCFLQADFAFGALPVSMVVTVALNFVVASIPFFIVVVAFKVFCQPCLSQ